MMLCGFASASYGLAISAGATDSKTEQALTVLIIMPLITLSGYLANLDTVPNILSWMQYISPPHYAYEAVIWDHFPYSKTKPYNVPNMQGMYMSYASCMLCLLALTIFFRIMAYYCLAKRAKDPIQ